LAVNGGPFFGSEAFTNLPGIFAPNDDNVAVINIPSNLSNPAETLAEGVIATKFGFNIPNAATIKGIEVKVRKRQSARAVDFGGTTDTEGGEFVFDAAARLVRNGNPGGADRRSDETWPNGENLEYVTYGGPTDLWGRSWTAAEINQEGFGFDIQARATWHALLRRFGYIDHIQIRTPAATSWPP
jgi:hypothetical protein